MVHDTYEYTSVDALLAVARHHAKKGQDSSHRWGRKQEWDLGAGWDGTLQMVEYGYPEGAARAKALSDSILHSGGNISLEVEGGYNWDVSGDCWDLGRHLEGRPDSWLSPEQEEKFKAIDIVNNVSCAHFTLASTIARKGAAICALIDALESRKIRVSVVNVWPCSSRSSSHSWNVKTVIKTHGERLDIDRMAFCVGHPAFMRRLLLSHSENTKWREYDTDRNYGTPQSINPSEYDPRAIIIGGCNCEGEQWTDDDFDTDEKCREWVGARYKRAVGEGE